MRLLFPVLTALSLFVLSACGSSPQVTQVTEQARTVEQRDQVPQEQTVQEPVRLRIGEARKIRSMDPLYAHHPGAQRLISLMYDGLTRLDENDQVQPALAESWEVGDDSLTYTFTLREDVFFHDDPSFSSGRGRNVTAEDVHFVFRRMTSYEIPPQAANLFADHIAGFEAFLLQERSTYFEEEVVYEQIRGIEVIDERTIAFTLNRPYENFPALLASPYASIYPPEVFQSRSGGLHATPVGAGAFVFSSLSSDTLITLERNFNHYEPGSVAERITSIELRYFDRESALFTALSTGKIDLIPQIGPQMSKTLLDTQTEALAPGYEGNFELVRTSPSFFSLYFVESNFQGLNRAQAAAHLKKLTNDEAQRELPPNLIAGYSENWEELLLEENQETETDLQAPFRFGSTNAAFPAYTAAVFASRFDDDQNPELHFIGRPHRDLIFFWSDIDQQLPFTLEEVARYTVHNFALTLSGINGIRFNEQSWWIGLDQFTKSDTDDPS